MSSYKYLLQVTVLVFCLAEGAESTVLSTSERVVEVNKSVTLNCSSSYGEVDGARYYIQLRTGERLPPIIIFNNEACIVPGISNIPLDILVACSARLFTLEIRNVTLAFHNSSVYCETYTGSVSNRSPDVVIKVAVSVNGAQIFGSGESSGLLTTIENNVTRLTCKTTPSYPASNVTWYREIIPSINTEVITEDIVSSENHEGNHLISVESNIKLNVSRDFNGTSIYCVANNGFGDKTSSNLQLFVQYPPSNPVFHVGEIIIGKYLKVITENVLSVSCSSDGYPPPSYLWVHKGKEISTNKLLTIPSTNESHNGTYVCKVNNTMKWNHIGENMEQIELTILIKPSGPTLHFNDSSEHPINRTMYVVKNDSFTIICKSTGVPTPVCSWNGTTNDNLTEMHVQEDFIRTCYASSKLVETVGSNEYITVNATLVVEVLYPPSTPIIQSHIYSKIPNYVVSNITVEEFGTLSLNCSAFSKPDVDVYTWSGPVNSTSGKVILHNISRHDCGHYTCHASNLMQRSFGNTQIGRSSKTVLIDVLYASEVTKFVAADKGNNLVITKEGENVTLLCNVDSNPSSSIDIILNDKQLVNNINIKTLTHFIRNISCYDAGIYNCCSFNTINYGKRFRKILLSL